MDRLAEFSVELIAEQLCLIDSVRPARRDARLTVSQELFQNVTVNELLEVDAWMKRIDSDPCVANINKMVGRFNQMSEWVVTEIVSAPPKEGAKKWKRLLQIAEHLLELRDFHGACHTFRYVLPHLIIIGVMAFVAGVNSLFVGRCAEHQKLLSSKAKAIQLRLESVVSSDSNYLRYREMLRQAEAAVPYLGVTMKDVFASFDSPIFDKESQRFNFSKVLALVSCCVFPD